jgi:hypothetical protein
MYLDKNVKKGVIETPTANKLIDNEQAVLDILNNIKNKRFSNFFTQLQSNENNQNQQETKNLTSITPITPNITISTNNKLNTNTTNTSNHKAPITITPLSIDNHSSSQFENIDLKKKYLTALNSKDHKRHFQVYYIFKNKIKRMYRIDCMTRKINVYV